MERLTEMELRILATLEEAWEDDICTILNTVYTPPSSADLTEYCDAARSLYGHGLVRVTTYKYGPRGHASKELPENVERELLRSLESWFGGLNDKGGWIYREKYSEQFEMPQLLVTEEGHDLAVRVLDKRGYQWWEHGG